ncbi:MAG TPA: bifunctional homocysteine S-methyltransferase/methylenetetrahydrofolate reductase [Planctomycetota bacterium]|nr:bifunctional homocysteine S-methyltransferase/methylenetetrahydrofolate reductase [Planctomycetota bacterium]
MSPSALLTALESRVVVGDGAMGTLIYSRGIPYRVCFEELNLSNPRLIKRIHEDYLKAGAEFHETNTFKANRLYLGRHELQGQVAQINSAGVRLARHVVGKERFVGASVGPLTYAARGEELSDRQKTDIFTEQIEALAAEGPDAIVLETFTDLKELLLAIAVVKKRTSLPVVSMMSFLERGRTPMGARADRAAVELAGAGADIVGVNCSHGPYWALQAVELMARVTRAKLAAFPNSGLPEFHEGSYQYLTTPDYFARMAKKMVDAGVNLIGGCCGTDPSHIQALAAKVKGARPAPRPIKLAAVVDEPEPEAPAPGKPKKTFFDRVGREPLIVVELDPPRSMEIEKTLKGVRRLKKAGVDAITVGDNPLAIVRMGNLAVAHLMEREGVQTIAHVSCRDRNLIALQSYIMEAGLLGITALLPITGDPARVGDQPEATSVYDLNSVELVRLVAKMNKGLNYQGNSIKLATSFRIGCAFNPNKTKIDSELHRLGKKIEAGAEFALTQPSYDRAQIERAWTAADKRFPGFPIFFGILPPLSARNAEFLANEVPGITIPRAVVERIAAVPEDRQAEEGKKVSKELIDFAYGFTKSFYMILPFNRADIGADFVTYVKTLTKTKVSG